jgi:hypothetical protein
MSGRARRCGTEAILLSRPTGGDSSTWLKLSSRMGSAVRCTQSLHALQSGAQRSSGRASSHLSWKIRVDHHHGLEHVRFGCAAWLRNEQATPCSRCCWPGRLHGEQRCRGSHHTEHWSPNKHVSAAASSACDHLDCRHPMMSSNACQQRL